MCVCVCVCVCVFVCVCVCVCVWVCALCVWVCVCVLQFSLGNLDSKRDWGHARDFVEVRAVYLWSVLFPLLTSSLTSSSSSSNLPSHPISFCFTLISFLPKNINWGELSSFSWVCCKIKIYFALINCSQVST